MEINKKVLMTLSVCKLLFSVHKLSINRAKITLELIKKLNRRLQRLSLETETLT